MKKPIPPTRRIAVAFLAALVPLLAAGTETGRVYRVVMDQAYPPCEFMQEPGRAQGFPPAQMEAIGAAARVGKPRRLTGRTLNRRDRV